MFFLSGFAFLRRKERRKCFKAVGMFTVEIERFIILKSTGTRPDTMDVFMEGSGFKPPTESVHD